MFGQVELFFPKIRPKNGWSSSKAEVSDPLRVTDITER